MKETKVTAKLAIIRDAIALEGYRVVLTSLYGSYNYALENERSDIDAYVVVMPTAYELLNDKRTAGISSCEIEGCNVVRCDIRTFVKRICKPSFRECEVLLSPWRIVEKDYEPLVASLDKLLFYEGGVNEWRQGLAHELHGRLSSYVPRIESEMAAESPDKDKLFKYIATMLYFLQFVERYFQRGVPFADALANTDEFILCLKNGEIPFPPAAIAEMAHELQAGWPQIVPLDSSISVAWQEAARQVQQATESLLCTALVQILTETYK